MQIEIEQLPSATLIRLKGCLMLQEVEQSKYEFHELIETQAMKCVLLDMSDVHLIDSSGIGLIIKGSNTMTRKGGKLKLFGLNSEIYLIFERMTLHKILSIYDSLEHALQSIQA
ncbi:MAG: STAS domain-containing protein [SAR324 cluster bacterium]|nr:STAS domain-containing protein [SAR324 cluster bacterium]